MNSQQAREILNRYRPGTGDENDAEVRAALVQSTQDPELAAWLENHRQFQRSMQAGVRDVVIPPGLREQILMERRAYFGLRSGSRRAVLTCAVVIVALIIGGLLFLPRRLDSETKFATFRSRMVRIALRGYAMEFESSKPDEIRQFLALRTTHGDWQSTLALDRQPLLGCALLTWRSQPTAMICYGRANQPDLWLFVVDTTALPDPPQERALEFARVNQLNTVGWNRGGKTYLLAGKVGEAELRKLVSGG